VTRLRTQIDAHAELILRMKQEGSSIRAIAQKLAELGVHYPYGAGSGWPEYLDPAREIAPAVRAWLNSRMTPVERLQERIATLESKLAEAEVELDRLLAQPPPAKVDPRIQWNARNQEIYDRKSAGETYAALAKRFSISVERVRQIVRHTGWKIERAQKLGPKVGPKS
jgi:hypothetical protein